MNAVAFPYVGGKFTTQEHGLTGVVVKTEFNRSGSVRVGFISDLTGVITFSTWVAGKHKAVLCVDGFYYYKGVQIKKYTPKDWRLLWHKEGNPPMLVKSATLKRTCERIDNALRAGHKVVNHRLESR